MVKVGRIIWYNLMIERLRVTELYINIQFTQLMLCVDIIALCSQIHTKHTHTLGSKG